MAFRIHGRFVLYAKIRSKHTILDTSLVICNFSCQVIGNIENGTS